MRRYVPLWSDLVESSVWREEPDHVRILWITMLCLQDGDHVVRKEPYALAFYANKTLQEVEDALRVLSSPDTHKPGQPHEGRRILKVDDGWLIVNGEKYQNAMIKANKREYMRRYMRERKARMREDKQAVKEVDEKGWDVEMPRSQPEVERAQMRSGTTEDAALAGEIPPAI